VSGRPRRFATAVALAAAGLAGCSGVSHSASTPSTGSPGLAVPTLPAPPAQTVWSFGRPSIIARLEIATDVHSSPAGPVVGRLGTSLPPTGAPAELLVLGRTHAAGRAWVDVRLPGRPNGASGWIDRSVVMLSTTDWRIVVDLRRRTLQAWNGRRLVRSFPAVVGSPSTPTPTGLFAVSDRIPLAHPRAQFYGSWILTLTAHSTVLHSFDGGDGLVAIHGRGGQSLSTPLGSALSHGCVRLTNDAIDWLAARAVPGTPVQVLA
jgi:lipoprotein-anchoring transpeptidase ErfK/SrfK